MKAILDKWDYVSKTIFMIFKGSLIVYICVKFQGARQRTIFKNLYDGVEEERGSTVLSKLS